MRWLLLCLCLAPPAAAAETVVASRTIRSQAVLGPADVALIVADVPGALDRPEAAIGLEARVMLYAGRPIRAADLAPPALVERNQIVTLEYRNGPLRLTAEGRALGRAGAGEALRVMNLASRGTVRGVVARNGRVLVGTAPASP
ncbi:flagella basal body P-ring formation protein FlgA [Rhodovulum iodosum]|uniref:Flagella basal body P-ring formation protein FlgA n=1 Tax=Rhodovulum iodosum TaxID=68291 RepID=A0ABV3XRF2_9RHOB|nr:flagellar basal body P-ring formation chaperone FlgA [Rhodovulum robiginosum]RSK40024.1 flagellar basal body P-ring formation protein FlgA [Rhodovulum robiginosum]